MFDWMFEKEPTANEKELERLYEMRKWYCPTSEEYEKINARIKDILELKEMEEKKGFQVTGDTVLKCACFVGIGTLIIFREELVGPITSKALSLATKFM